MIIYTRQFLWESQDISAQSVMENQHVEQQYRASAYSILAALLRGVPAKDILEHVVRIRQS